MIAYKLTNENIQTHNGYQWTVGEKQSIEIDGNEMCTNQVFHYYDHPLIAAFMNPIHANISNPLLWEVEIEKSIAHDGLKGGCKSMTLVRAIELPVITTLQQIEIAIRLALINYNEPGFVSWANAWLSEEDRTAAAADEEARAAAEAEAEWAARAAARAAEWAARAAARAAEWAARAAAMAAACAAACAAKSVDQEFTKTIFIPILEKVCGWK